MIYTVPKPQRREKKAPKHIPSESEKHKAKRFAGELPTKVRVEIARTAIKTHRPKHEVKQMGTASRRAFVRSLPCCACGVEGFSVNAHTTRRSGMGMKGKASDIVPLCGPRPMNRGGMYDGCHYELDNGRGREWLESTYRIDLLECAAQTNAAYETAKREGALPL